MKWTIRIGALLAILLALYTVWPFWGLYQLARAVQTRDAAAVEERVDFPELRLSLTSQIVRAYLKLMGRDSGGAVSSFAAGLGTSIADPIVAKLLNPEALIQLLGSSQPSGTGTAVRLDQLSLQDLGSLWQLYANSEYSGRNFYVSVPSGAAAEPYRLHLRLSRMQWKLAGLELPAAVSMRLAQEIGNAAQPPR
jgi:hypothetical protein